MNKNSKKREQRPVPSVLRDALELIRPQRGLLALGLVLIAISRAAGFVLPISSKYLLDDVIGQQQMDLLGPIVLAVLAASAVQAVTSYSLTQLLSKEAQRMITELRRKVQRHIGRLPVAYYDVNKTGSLVSRIMSDVEGVRNLVGTGLVELLGGFITAAGAFFVLIYISPFLTFMAAGQVVVFTLVLYWAFKRLRPIFRERGRLNAEVTGRLTESLGGVRVIKGYHGEEREADVFSAGVQRLLENVIKSLTGTSLVRSAAILLVGCSGALVMYFGVHQIADGVMTLGDLATFVLFLTLMVSPVYQMVSIGTQITEAFAGLERTREVLQENPEDLDPRRTVELGPVRGAIQFEGVSFAYQAGKPVLHDVSFEARPGSVTALVGPSGSGKSTIIGLVAAFHKPSAGTVRVDGVDLSTARLSSYRTKLGVVLQDTFLFAGTIRENVAFARPDATEAEILEACRIARVDEFAEGFDDKYETIVGERGVRLSGGQRQRVSIARAILADPRILILDEATSSLDSESEALIQEGLSYLMKGRTTFVIAHRLSTIRRADQILVIEQGHVLERGTHESLYALGGRYFDLYTKQHGVESNLFLAPGEGNDEEERDTPETREEREAASPLRLLRGE